MKRFISLILLKFYKYSTGGISIQAGLLKDIVNLVWLLKGINDNHM